MPDRNLFIKQLNEIPEWDIIVVGGGATGLGIAVDSASRGFKTLLLEQSDFAKGTSGRSTKLVHGGVRYLAQGRFRMVYQALNERGFLLKNAPHLVKIQSFIIPSYTYFSHIKYMLGLMLYDMLSGKKSFGRSVWMSRKEILKHVPVIKQSGLKGGVRYFDGQFDDARLAINLAQTAVEQGSVVLNYFKVTKLIKKENKIKGLIAVDIITGSEYSLKAKVVINATGVFVDDIMKMDEANKKSMVRPSQGIHLVVSSSFLPGDNALMIPETKDGRVLFAIPWKDHILIGTTDTTVNNHSLEPQALEEEIDFILETAAKYLAHHPEKKDVLSVFAGLRPLAAIGDSIKTKEISRDHKIMVSDSDLITITGGKWTTYRKMAEETVDKAIRVGKFPCIQCISKYIMIHGGSECSSYFGSDEEKIQDLISENPQLGNILIAPFPYRVADIVWGVRNEMAITIEDVLARRMRLLFIDAKAALNIAPKVASIMAHEKGHGEEWERIEVINFKKVAENYILKG